MRPEPLAADVCLGGSMVGTLRFRPDTQATIFRPAPALAAKDGPVLGQEFLDDPVQPRVSRLLAPAWFSNLLPEGALRTFLRLRMNVADEHEFRLLVALGRDLPGAATIVEADTKDDGDVWPDRAPPGGPIQIRHSLSGVQPKLSATRSKNRLVVSAVGELGDCIVKLPTAEHPELVDNELAMMTWAREAGLDVPPAFAVPLGDIDGLPEGFAPRGARRAYVIGRFDRAPAGVRIHFEDLAQVIGARPAEKYDYTFQTVANVVLRVCGREDLAALLGRLVFCAACGNGDAHLKNWALIYADGRTPRLSPGYDLVSTTLLGYPDTMALPLLRERRWGAVGRDLLTRFAARLDMDAAWLLSVVREAGERVWASWEVTEPALDLPASARAAIAARRERLPLFRV